METAETRPAFPNVPFADAGILWSPNSKWLATYNDNEETTQIALMEIETGKEVVLPNNSNQLGSWSPDSRFLLHPDFTIDANANILTNFLLQYDTQTGTSNTLLTSGSTENDCRYGNPLLSPDGKLLALSMRTIRCEVAHLWVVETYTRHG